MGAIQNSINSALGVVAAGATLGKRVSQEDTKLKMAEEQEAAAQVAAKSELEQKEQLAKEKGKYSPEATALDVAKETANDFVEKSGYEDYTKSPAGRELFDKMYRHTYDSDRADFALKTSVEETIAKQVQRTNMKAVADRVKKTKRRGK